MQKTGMVEAYIEDFQGSAINEVRNTYYSQSHISAKPVIIFQKNLRAILSPPFAKGCLGEEFNRDLSVSMDGDRGQFYTHCGGEKV